MQASERHGQSAIKNVQLAKKGCKHKIFCIYLFLVYLGCKTILTIATPARGRPSQRDPPKCSRAERFFQKKNRSTVVQECVLKILFHMKCVFKS